MENKRSIGSEKECVAAEYLKEQGAEVLAQNFYFKGGELDLVARDGEYMCFIEVKYRTSNRHGMPEEAVTALKKKRMINGAKQYMYEKRIPFDTPCRFDIIAIYKEQIQWIKDAFWE